MDYFPLFADLTDRRCLVVGGGRVARRKVGQLLRAGAHITVNALELDPELAEMARTGKIDVSIGDFDPDLIRQHLLVIAATSDSNVNRNVAQAADQHQRLCNVVDDREHSSFIVPGVVDRAPLTIAVSSGGRSPVLTTVIRQKIEQMLPRRLGAVARWAGEWREAVRAKIPDASRRLRFWRQVIDGEARDLLLAGRDSEADRSMVGALSREQLDTTATSGEAYIVGAGPGEPDLITVEGSRLLQQADVILHDRLISPELLELARRDAEIISVGKSAGGDAISQREINALLIELVQQGHRVCRLKGGDPFMFGRGGEEAEVLRDAGLRYRVVPGITAAIGCAAYAGIPLTFRGLSRTLVVASAEGAGSSHALDWDALAGEQQTLAIYMGVRQIDEISQQLIAHGRDAACAAAVIENGTTAGQRIVRGTLAEIAARAQRSGVRSPALLVVGEVVAFADRLAWFETSSGADNASERTTTWAQTAPVAERPTKRA